MMFIMLFALGSGAMFAQLDSEGGDGEVYLDIDACTNAIPEMTATSDMMVDGYNDDVFSKCSESSEDFAIHFVEEDGYGEWGVSTGFTEGSDNCNWTYYYVYIIKCDGNQTMYTIQYTGGDRTPPQLQKDIVLEPEETKNINACFDDRPLAPYGAETLASYFEDSCGHDKSGDLEITDPVHIGLRTKTTQGDCDWTVIYVYTISDECDETEDVELTFTYSGGDKTPPEFETTPGDVTVECGFVPEALGLDWTDNCGGSGTSALPVDTGFEGPDCAGGVITRTWTITDECNNETVHVQKITVDPAEPIAFLPIDDIDVPCADRDNIADYIPQAHYTNNPQGSRTTSIGCVISGNVDGEYEVPDTSCGSFKVTYKFEDECGNTIDLSVTVNIVDNINPSIDVAASDVTVECGVDTKEGLDNDEAYQDWLDNNGYAEARDNCDDDLDWSNDSDSKTWSDDCGDTGSITVVFIAYDDCGNESKTVATFAIVDSTPPTMTDAKSIVAVCDGAGNYAQYEAWLNDHATATASDECDDDLDWTHDGPTDEVELLEALGEDYNGCSEFTGSVEVTFTVTDDCDHDNSRSATFSIVDSLPPTFNVEASNDTVECDDNTNNPTNMDDYQAWLDSHGGAEAKDVCSDVSWSHDNPRPTGNACAWVYTVTFTATDECGNYATTTASFTIEDTLSPAISDHAEDLTVECGYDDTDQDFADWLADNGGANAIDLCDDDLTWTNDYNKRPFSDDCGETGSITVLFTVTDDCGNSSSSKGIFTIEDTMDPYWDGFPRDRQLYKDEDCFADTTPYNTGGPGAYDYCSDVTIDYSDSRTTGDCGDYVIIRTWSAEDDCGNIIYRDQNISVMDDMAPDQVGDIPLGESEMDLCEAPDGPTVEDIRVLFEDNCTAQADLVITRTRTDVEDSVCDWMVVYTYNVEDLCGNAIEEFKIIYSGGDTSAPTLKDGPRSDWNREDYHRLDVCFDERPTGPSEDEIREYFMDNCTDREDINVNKYERVRRDGCYWSTKYYYEVSDDCGNYYDTFYIGYTGEDHTPPELVGTAPGVISDLEACMDGAEEAVMYGPGLPSGDDIMYLFRDCGPDAGDGISYVDVPDYDEAVVTGNDCYWVATYTYVIWDNCRNSTELKVQYTGGDRTAPYLYDYSPTTKYSEFDVCIDDARDAIDSYIADDYSIMYYYADNCDEYLEVSHTVADATGTDCNWEIIVTYTIEDDCGNSTDLEVAYNGGDDTAPVREGNYNEFFSSENYPEYEVCVDIAMETVLSSGNILADKEIALLYEDCSGVTVTHTVEWEYYNSDDNCYWDIHVYYTIVDACDNYSYLTTHHFGGDKTAPTADPLEPIEVKCDDPIPDPDTGLVNASDNCDTDVYVDWIEDVSNNQNPETITRTYGLWDDCQNYSEVTQLIEVSTCFDTPTDSEVNGELKELDFKAYPVPFNKDVTLNYNFDFDTDVRVEVYDTRGLLVLTKEVKGYTKGSDVNLPLNISSGADQMYYVKLITNQGTVIKKIVSSNVNRK